MGIQVRDERQMKALTGLSPAQFDDLLAVFNDIYWVTQQKRYEEGRESGTRRRKPRGGTTGKWPTITDKLLWVLYSYKTYPTCDVLGTQCEMARSKAHENESMEKLGISDELRSCHAGHDRSHLKYRIMLSNAWQHQLIQHFQASPVSTAWHDPEVECGSPDSCEGGSEEKTCPRIGQSGHSHRPRHGHFDPFRPL